MLWSSAHPFLAEPASSRSLGCVCIDIRDTEWCILWSLASPDTLHDSTYKYLHPTHICKSGSILHRHSIHTLQCPNSNIVSYCSDAYIWSQTHCTSIQRSTYYFDKRLENIHTWYRQRREEYCWRCLICCTCIYIALNVLIVEDTGAADDQLPVEAR